MMMPVRFFLPACLILPPVATGATGDTSSTELRTVEQVAETVQKSLVVLEATGREGRLHGEGTGFAIADDLIATARHVIGDGRPIHLLLPNGRRPKVTHVHAHAASVDVLILRTEPHGLPPLELAGPGTAKPGVNVVALGHPHGLRNSVVAGVISGRREIDGISMIQLAMAIEPGNSGGPVVDSQGVVLGMVTLKSAASDNIGFAIPIRHLKTLLASPNPVPIDRWIRIGALDGRWEVTHGGTWKQRAGRISPESPGTGFGGRTLCLLKKVPHLPVEIEVSVRLDDERGAAGLAFHADGNHRHYGFYPSAGNLRFTRFDGPAVESWTILHNEPHSVYRSGDWNTLKVRVESEKMDCYVNGEHVFTSVDSVLLPGHVGYAAFRGTRAQFRSMTIAPSIPSSGPTDEQQERIAKILETVRPSRPPVGVIDQLLPLGPKTDAELRKQADLLEAKARRIRHLADDLHAARVRTRLLDLLTPDADESEPNEETDLLHAALLLAQLDNPDVRPAEYIERVDLMAEEIRSGLSDTPNEERRLAALDRWLFEENGFRGGIQQYYTRANSYLNEVIDDREGLPISLSVLYMELARRLDLNVAGIGMPGHFIVQFRSAENPATREWIDVFHRGRRLSQQDVQRHIRAQGLPLLPQFTEVSTSQQIIERMLRNLLNLAESDRDDRQVLKYLEVLLALSSDNSEFRAKRLELRARSGLIEAAIEDADWFLEHQPRGADIGRLEQLKAGLQQQLRPEND